ncbi:MAG: molybdopterin-guanine dinucleotide biosynthesis protein MobB [Sulfolobales archaeon]
MSIGSTLDIKDLLRSKCVIHVIGSRDSGKTSAIVEALKHLSAMGYKVAVIKHTHHSVDTPFKDTWRYIHNGGALISVAVKDLGEEIAIFIDGNRGGDAAREVLSKIIESVDLVIVEGYSGVYLGDEIHIDRPSDIPIIANEILSRALKCVER